MGITSVRADAVFSTRAPEEEGPPEGAILEIFDLRERTKSSVENGPYHFGVVEHRVRYLLDQHPRDARLSHAERTVDEQDHLPIGEPIASSTFPARSGALAGDVMYAPPLRGRASGSSLKFGFKVKTSLLFRHTFARRREAASTLSPHLPESAPRELAPATRRKRLAGCRGFSGPVPPPLSMSVLALSWGL